MRVKWNVVNKLPRSRAVSLSMRKASHVTVKRVKVKCVSSSTRNAMEEMVDKTKTCCNCISIQSTLDFTSVRISLLVLRINADEGWKKHRTSCVCVCQWTWCEFNPFMCIEFLADRREKDGIFRAVKQKEDISFDRKWWGRRKDDLKWRIQASFTCHRFDFNLPALVSFSFSTFKFQLLLLRSCRVST